MAPGTAREPSGLESCNPSRSLRRFSFDPRWSGGHDVSISHRTFQGPIMSKFGIGQAITRREDQRLLTGSGKYLDDMSLPNEAHVAFLRSPHAHARIASIDVDAAKRAPGVIAVFSGKDLQADGIGNFPIGPGLTNAAGKPMSAPPYYPLAIDEVRFVGE